MSEEPTQNISGADGRSFEERVFARFDALEITVSSGFQELDARLQKLEARSYDTKPIWEQALKEIADTRRELVDMRRQVTKRLDRFEAVVFQTRSDLGDIEDRVEKLEAKPTQ
jgi:BMFP domain-containing protein YqiC